MSKNFTKGGSKKYPINKKNIFKGQNSESYRFTHHFFRRWNERIKEPRFDNKKELADYIRKKYPANIVKHVSGDYYIMSNLIVTCAEDKKKNNIVFITVYGTIENNPILYNILITQGVKGVKKTHKLYGKIPLKKFH